MNKTISALVLSGLLMACGGADAESDDTLTDDSAGDETGGDDGAGESTFQATCAELFTRERGCDEFLPGLVALRVQMDHPEGIAAQDAHDADALMAEARAEWANDSTDDAIATRCAGIESDLGPDALGAAESGMQRCLAHAECAPFVECDLEMVEQRFTIEREQQTAVQAD